MLNTRQRDEVVKNIAQVQSRIAAAATRAGRNWEEITLLAVTKMQPLSAVQEALAAGLTEFGENYVQEAVEKNLEVANDRVRWHLIGHLQRNKAKIAVETFALIQSVDSLKLAAAIARHARDAGKTQDILLQVHLGEEETKTGLPPEQIGEAAAQIAEMPGIRLRGLMGIAPNGMEARPYFQQAKRLFQALPLEQQQILSLGMSGDFETAIEEGSTVVRVGTAIFGRRN